MSNRIHIRMIAALAGLALLGTAPAQARTVYDVEIVVFENRDVPADAGERWRPEVIVPRFDRTAAFQPDDPVGGRFIGELPEGFGELERDRFRLDDEKQRLEESDRYRVLRHAGWHQPALEPDDSVSLRIRAGEPIEVDVPVRDLGPYGDAMRIEEILRQAVPAARRSQDAGQDAGEERWVRMGLLPRTRRIPVYPLDGTVRIVVRRYLHVHADLLLTQPVEWAETPDDLRQATVDDRTADNGGGDDGATIAGTALAPEVALGPDGQPMLSYPFRQQRRMRSGELHYLDHPVIGMLVLATPRESDSDDRD